MWTTTRSFEADNIWSNALDIYRYDGAALGSGPIYALPKDVSAFAVVYNKDLFKAAGVAPPTEEAPWDWNDYREAAVKLTSGDVYGTGMYCWNRLCGRTAPTGWTRTSRRWPLPTPSSPRRCSMWRTCAARTTRPPTSAEGGLAEQLRPLYAGKAGHDGRGVLVHRRPVELRI